MDQFYQDFNIINNTVNRYSSMNPGSMEHRSSAIDSKDYKNRYNFHKRIQENHAKLESNASASTNFEREGEQQKLGRTQTYKKLPDSSRFLLNTERTRMTSGYYNILAHDNSKQFRDEQSQMKIINEIKGNANTFRQNLKTPITADNNIVFIDRDSIIRRPKEFKTPPPPMYGEEPDYDYDRPIPRHEFYDPINDPHTRKFDFLDSRIDSVSNHYQKYINSKTEKKRKKLKKKTNDSLDESEKYDRVNELPGLEVQMEKTPLMYVGYQTNQPLFVKPFKNTYRSVLNRAMSHSPSSMRGSKNDLVRSSTLKETGPAIMAQTMYKSTSSAASFKDKGRQGIRSGAFQRINSVDQYKSKY